MLGRRVAKAALCTAQLSSPHCGPPPTHTHTHPRAQAVPKDDARFADGLEQWETTLLPQIIKLASVCPQTFDEMSVLTDTASGIESRDKGSMLQTRFKHLQQIMQCVGQLCPPLHVQQIMQCVGQLCPPLHMRVSLSLYLPECMCVCVFACAR